MKRLPVLFSVALMFATLPSFAVAEAGSAEPDSPGPAHHAEAETHHALHPPISIGAGHTLKKGHFAIGYTYQRRAFRGVRDGRSSLSSLDVLSQFARAPLSLDVERHEIALMYAPVSRITLMAQLPVLRKELRESDGMVRSTVRSEGVGDLTLTAITRFMEKDDQRLFFGVELGTPTGSVHATDTVEGIRERLSYPMQLGLGAWHIQTALTYQAHSWKYTWGGQMRTLFRLGESDLGYKHGNRYTVSGWLSRRWLRWLSSSLRLEWRKWGNIHGVDPALDPTRSPTADAKRQAGQQLDLGMGLDLNLPFVAHQSLAFEAVVPLVRDLDGPQIEEEWRVQVGWRWSL